MFDTFTNVPSNHLKLCFTAHQQTLPCLRIKIPVEGDFVRCAIRDRRR
jgi:hypothetical protein